MKSFTATATRVAVTAAIGLTVVVAAAGPAAAADDWEYVRTYPTALACNKDGHHMVQDGSADRFSCRGTGNRELWIK